MKKETAITGEGFIRILQRRLEGRFSQETIRTVLDAYLSSSFGVLARIKKREEFKDKYFGAFCYTEKGYENFRKEVSELMRKKLLMSKLIHETLRRKKTHEKRNKAIWMVGNLTEGYRYVRVPSEENKSHVKTKIKQNEYLADRKRASLKIAKKVRRSIKS